jgi:hypothetical protein
MLHSAIEQQVTEKGDLDWKKELPNRRHPGASEEFAKDVAAMVNGGGGMIVYGVEEDRISSAAKQIVPVAEWTDAIERKLRSWAYSLIQPPVHGLEFTALEEPIGGSLVVVLTVPPSLETPHFAMKDDALRAPRRYGAQTVFMSERDIEQAYRTRFEDRRNSARNLSDLLDQAMTGFHQTGAWLAAAARPVRPRPAYSGRISREEAADILVSFKHMNPFLKARGGFEYADANARPGYRKWRSRGGQGGQTYGIVDIHDDGSVSLAHEAKIDRGDWDADTDIHVMDAQQLPAHIVHLARATAERLEVTCDYEISMILRSPSNEPIFIRTLLNDHLRNRDYQTAIHEFQPVSGILAANVDGDEALETVRSLALDVMNQGGSEALGVHYLKDRMPAS